jgi:hypothetical protein
MVQTTLRFGDDILGRAVSFTNPEVCGSDIDLPNGWRRVEPDTLEHCAVGNDISEPRNWKDVAARFKTGDMADDGPAYKDNCVVCYDIWMEVRSLDPAGAESVRTVPLLKEPTTGGRAIYEQEPCDHILNTTVGKRESNSPRFIPRNATKALAEALGNLRRRSDACTRFAFNVFARWSFIPGNSYRRGDSRPCARTTATRVLSTAHVPAALTADRKLIFGPMRGGLADALAATLADVVDAPGNALPAPREKPQLAGRKPVIIFPPFVPSAVTPACGCPGTPAELPPACRITDVTSVVAWRAVGDSGEVDVHQALHNGDAWLAKRIRDYLQSSAGTNGKLLWGERQVKSAQKSTAWDCARPNVVDLGTLFRGAGTGLSDAMMRHALKDQPGDDNYRVLIMERRVLVRYEYACGYGCVELGSRAVRSLHNGELGTIDFIYNDARHQSPKECYNAVRMRGVYDPITDYEPIWTDKLEAALSDALELVANIAEELVAQLCKIFPDKGMAQKICMLLGGFLFDLTPAGVVSDIANMIAVASDAFAGGAGDFADFFADVRDAFGDGDLHAILAAFSVVTMFIL